MPDDPDFAAHVDRLAELAKAIHGGDAIGVMDAARKASEVSFDDGMKWGVIGICFILAVAHLINASQKIVQPFADTAAKKWDHEGATAPAASVGPAKDTGTA